MNTWIQNLRTLIKLLAVLGILIFLNVIATQKNIEWDMTEKQIYSLEQRSKKIARNVDEKVQLLFFHTPKAAGSQIKADRVRRLARQYADLNEKITFQEYNHSRNPNMARKYNIRSNNSVVVKVGGRTKTLGPYDMLEFGGRMRRQRSFRGEKALSTALLKLTQSTDHIVYFTTGHGEHSIQSSRRGMMRRRRRRSRAPSLSAWSQGLKKEGYKVKTLDLLTDKMPDTSNLVIVAQPSEPFSKKVSSRLSKWQQNGGNLIVAAGPSAAKNVNDALQPADLKIQSRQIIDPGRRVQTLQSLVNPFLFAPVLKAHPSVVDVKKQGLGIQVNRSAPLAFTSNMPDTPKKILTTSAEAFAKPLNPEGRLKASFNSETDKRGPFTIAASRDRPDAGKIAVIGNAGVFTNSLLRQAPGNKNFALNLVSWIFDRDVNVGVRSTPSDYNKVQVTANQAYVLQILALFVIPGFIILWGGWVWWKRRNL